jgi:hypothetical protein
LIWMPSKWNTRPADFLPSKAGKGRPDVAAFLRNQEESF